MSAKKGARKSTGGAAGDGFWFQCPKCRKKYPKIILQKHTAATPTSDKVEECPVSYPFIKHRIPHVVLMQVTDKSAISRLPFIKSRIAAWTLFLSEDIILECGFKSYDWLMLKPAPPAPPAPIDQEEEEPSIIPIAFRVFPLTEHNNISGSSSGALLTLSALNLLPIWLGKPTTKKAAQIPVQLYKIPGIRIERPIHFSTFNTLRHCQLEILPDQEEIAGVKIASEEEEEGRLNFCMADQERLLRNFKRLFMSRILANGNQFKFRFYTRVLMIRVKIAAGGDDGEPASKTEQELERNMAGLNLTRTGSPAGEICPKFYEVTYETQFSLKLVQSNKATTTYQDQESVNLSRVGGLDSVVGELSSTIQYILDTKSKSKIHGSATSAGFNASFPCGIILYGNHGTGKSLLTAAICNQFKLNNFTYQEFTNAPSKPKTTAGIGNGNYGLVSSNLNELFMEAIKHSPSAVLIEDLDAVGTKITSRSNSDVNSNFISQLRSQMERLSNNSSTGNLTSTCSGVIVLATCTELDSIDSSLRSPHIFGKEIEIPVPAAKERLEILNKLLNNVKHSLSMQDIEEIAGNTHGFVGADLKSLLSQASLYSAGKFMDRSFQQTLTPTMAVEIVTLEMEHMQACIKNVHPSAMKSILIDVPNVKWEDIGGQSELKFKLKQAIEWPLKHPEAFKRLGITPPKGILMYGPPGCSKTMIAKAIATESGLNFISVKGSELFSKWVGESEKAVKALFRKARQVSPCIVFLDELDSLGSERGNNSSTGGASNVHERVLAQLLIEIDGIEPLKDVTIVAATNRPDIIDPALLRPGRLDRIIYVPLPNKETRAEIFNIHFKRMPVDTSTIDMELLVSCTENYSGAEITAICQEAALIVLEHDINACTIYQEHFVKALERIPARTSKEQIEFYEKYCKK